MPIPKYDDFMLPLLKLSGDRKEKVFRESVKILAEEFELTEDEWNVRLKYGQRLVTNRVGWALQELKRALLLESTGRGRFCITDRGMEVLQSSPERIDRSFLTKFEEFREYLKRTPKEVEDETPDSPLETMEASYEKLRKALVQEILENVKALSPSFFERLVVKLLLRMGYGVSGEESGLVLGGPGDKGVDGVIWQDKLGLDRIYIQAKRWDDKRPVSGPVATQFVGALGRKKANKGVLMTTSSFTDDAKNCVEEVTQSIVLIDGERLAELMIEHGLGVEETGRFVVHRIDSGFFEEDDI